MASHTSYSQSSSNLPTDLVVVCCHAIYHGGVDGDPHDESQWALEPFQRSDGFKQGEHLTFLRHIEAGLKAAGDNGRATLVFSGGCTNREYQQLSEARSYRDAAHAVGLSEDRLIYLEELATDSYQNLLFSILMFRGKFNRYPDKVKVVTHDFKVPRFRTHAATIGWPIGRLETIGINPPFSDEELQLTLALESQTHNSWKQDPYGKGQALSIKREKRCWNDLYLAGLRTGVEEEVQDLLSWAGNRAEKMFPVNRLPWNQT